MKTFRDAVLKHVGLRKMYIMILKEKRCVCLAMQAIAYACEKKQIPILIHCIHGKDRTGLIIALTLLICNVDEETVLRDYAASGPILRNAKHTKLIREDSPMWLEDDEHIVTPISVMRAVLSWMKKKTSTGNANRAAGKYLQHAGLSEKHIQIIQFTFMSDSKSKY